MRQLTCISLLICLIACNNPKEDTPAQENNTVQPILPTAISYQLVNEFPHDPSAFTEGLQYVDGFFYESTGEYGASDIRKVDIKSGKVISKEPLVKKYFGEGLTIINGKIYQLTYREGTGFVYDLKSLKRKSTFSFNNAEGWGMTNDGNFLIMDDGGSTLYYMDTATLKEVKKVEVSDEHGPLNNLNELEYIKGFIYANVWQTDLIVKIDPATGKVVGRADLSDLRQKAGIVSIPGNSLSPEVMNGIAYDSANNRIFITGKYWPKMFEVKLDN